MTVQATLNHSHIDGTMLDIDDLRPYPEKKRAVKAAGFKWSRNIGWYLPRSRDNDLTSTKAAALVQSLGEADISLDLEIDNTAQGFEDKIQAQMERSSDRADALHAKAERRSAEADTLVTRHNELASVIPMGQPILEGHYSAPRHKSHLAKMRRQLEKSSDASRDATDARRRARAAGHNSVKGSDGTFLVNRILEAERNKDGSTVEEIVSYMTKQGFRFVDPSTLEAGQRWNVRRSYVEIVKVNRKTATVKAIHQDGRPIFPGSITNRIDLRYFHSGPPSSSHARLVTVDA